MSDRRFDMSLSLRGLLTGEHRKATIVLLLAPVLITTWKYYGVGSFYRDVVSSLYVWGGDVGFTAEAYTYLSAFVLFALVPWAVIRFVFRERMRDYGWQIGDWRFGWKSLAVMAPIMVLSTIPSASMPDFMAEYPLDKGAGASGFTFARHALMYLLFYVGWEILFRGFMQHGLRSLGDWNAILIQTALSCIAHIGKPAGEIYSSIIGALVWGIVVFRSKSLLYVLIVHWLLGVSLDYFIAF
jgi:membrane protease YdiL (CAAX protease family)